MILLLQVFHGLNRTMMLEMNQDLGSEPRTRLNDHDKTHIDTFVSKFNKRMNDNVIGFATIVIFTYVALRISLPYHP